MPQPILWWCQEPRQGLLILNSAHLSPLCSDLNFSLCGFLSGILIFLGVSLLCHSSGSQLWGTPHRGYLAISEDIVGLSKRLSCPKCQRETQPSQEGKKHVSRPVWLWQELPLFLLMMWLTTLWQMESRQCTIRKEEKALCTPSLRI